MKHARQQDTKDVPNQYAMVPLPTVLDRGTVPYLRTQLLQLLQGKVNVRVDMSDVCTIDTAAIAVFVECLRVAKDHGATFSVVRPPECARGLMRLTKLDQLLAGTFGSVIAEGHPLGPRTILPRASYPRTGPNESTSPISSRAVKNLFADVLRGIYDKPNTKYGPDVKPEDHHKRLKP
jgi:anti-anti-sigma factor